MTGSRRILFLHGDSPVDLTAILGSLAGWDLDAVQHGSVTAADSADVLALDGHLAPDTVRDLVSSLAISHPSSPILLAIESDQVQEWASFLSLGIQDLIFVDTDSSADGLRRLLGAVHNHHLLRATQEAEIRLRTIIEHIDDGVLILSSDSEILFANPAAEYLLGQTLDDLFGLRVPFGLPTEGDEIVSLTTRQGDERMLSVQVHSVRWEGQDTRLLAFRDVTAEQEIRNQLRRARHAAEEAASMKSSFLANMSHELRMPLASIIGYADLIKDGTDDADLEEFAGSIKENGQRLLTTINAVLEATRLEKHHIEPQIASLRLDTLVDDVENKKKEKKIFRITKEKK